MATPPVTVPQAPSASPSEKERPVYAATYSTQTGLVPPDGPAHGLTSYVIQRIEEGNPKNPVDAVTLTYVQGLQMQQQHSLDRRHTFSSLYEQSSGFRERVFSINGRSGDRKEDIIKFKKLRNFIEEYALKKGETENAFYHEKKHKLILNFGFEGERFECSILSFSYQREVGATTHSYIYNISIATNCVYVERPLAAPAPPSVAPTPAVDTILADPPPTPPADNNPGVLRNPRDLVEDPDERVVSEVDFSTSAGGFVPTGALDEVDTQGSTLDNAIKKAAGAEGLTGGGGGGGTLSDLSIMSPAPVKEALAKGTQLAAQVKDDLKVTKKAVDAIKKPGGTNWVEDVYQFVGGTDLALYKSVAKVLTSPLDEVNKARRFITPIISGINNLTYSVKSVVGAYYNFLPELKSFALSSRDAVLGAVDTLKKTWGMVEDLTSSRYWDELGQGLWSKRRAQSMSVYLPGSNTPVVVTPTPSGVTDAYSAAQVFLGDRSRWYDIVRLNNMQDPYTKYNGLPLSVGDPIIAPSTSAGSTPSQLARTGNELGSDLMVKDGDLVLNGTGGLKIVYGQENLRQSLSHRFKTPKGANKAFPAFGLPKILNERQTSTLLAQFWSEMQYQTLADRRVSRIQKLQVVEAQTQYIAEIRVEFANGLAYSTALAYNPL